MEWRRLARFPDYEISEYGEVRRLKRGAWAPSGRVAKGWADRYGRRRVKLIHADGRKHEELVHRLVAETFIGPCPFQGHSPAALLCCHQDGDYGNNHYSNLYYGTQKQNMADRERHGRTPRGETQGRAKLTEADVIEIRERYAKNRPPKKHLGAEYGVTGTLISLIVRGVNWSHVGGPRAA